MFPFAGLDEAGRGPLAGPVVAAAVIWNYQNSFTKIIDPKLLSKKRRRELFDFVITKAEAVSVGWASPTEIDRINILNAALLAMARAVQSLEIHPKMLLIDGNRKIPYIDLPQTTVVGGDGKLFAVSAAGVVAKVVRDNLMRHFDEKYPGYGFAQNAGYPTKRHKEALSKIGPCPIHRRSFRGVEM